MVDIKNSETAIAAGKTFKEAFKTFVENAKIAIKETMEEDITELLINPDTGQIIRVTPKSEGQWRPDLPNYKGGALRDSIHTETKIEKDGIVLNIIAGGDAPNFPDIGFVEYAFTVHELMDESSNFTTPGTGPKYLNVGFDAATNDIRTQIVIGTRQRLSGKR